MRFKSNKPQLQYLFLKNKIVKDKEKENIKYHIAPATCCIPKRLQRHIPAEWRVKKIYQG